jgi:hypothetical protein
MHLPSWVNDPTLDEEERNRRQVKYHLRRAALWHNEDASVIRLGQAMGLGSNTLANGIRRGSLSKQLALAVEAFVDGTVSREQLAPKHFTVAEV